MNQLLLYIYSLTHTLRRYYYKYKIFEIAPNKRLVYKFGSRATGWKPRSSGNADTAGENDPAFIGPNHRCSKCLRLLETQEATQVSNVLKIN